MNNKKALISYLIYISIIIIVLISVNVIDNNKYSIRINKYYNNINKTLILPNKIVTNTKTNITAFDYLTDVHFVDSFDVYSGDFTFKDKVFWFDGSGQITNIANNKTLNIRTSMNVLISFDNNYNYAKINIYLGIFMIFILLIPTGLYIYKSELIAYDNGERYAYGLVLVLSGLALLIIGGIQTNNYKFI